MGLQYFQLPLVRYSTSKLTRKGADLSGRGAQGVGIQTLNGWDRRF